MPRPAPMSASPPHAAGMPYLISKIMNLEVVNDEMWQGTLASESR
jgi:hypothetical protein